jgi:hypothetical protein
MTSASTALHVFERSEAINECFLNKDNTNLAEAILHFCIIDMNYL